MRIQGVEGRPPGGEQGSYYPVRVSPALVTAVSISSPAARAGLTEGDQILSINGISPLDVIEYHQLTDDEDPVLLLERDGEQREVTIGKQAGEGLGIGIESPVFDRIRTCDNHCEFCFIYQLPKGLRKSLYVKDDDYRLSFLYGNFTTLTRFTELDIERVITEKLSPLYVSIHSTDPHLRAEMLRNPRGATSLSWLTALLDADIEVHGQVVLCPGVNDGPHLEATLESILDRYAKMASVGVVPLGVSKFSTESRMRPHSDEEARQAVAIVEKWQGLFKEALGHSMVYASDEIYLQAGIAIPSVEAYDGYPQAENGIGLVRRFIEEFSGNAVPSGSVHTGFFQSVDGAPAHGYRANRLSDSAAHNAEAQAATKTVILTGAQFAPVLRQCLMRAGFDDVATLVVANNFFGGNTAVSGLMVSEDILAAIGEPEPKTIYVLPDSCLTEGRFLDGVELTDLRVPLVTIEATGSALRSYLEAR